VTTEAPAMEPKICEEGGAGTVFPLFREEHAWDPGLRAVLYILAMLYLFLGVNVAADRFVAAIESITSKKKRVRLKSTGRLVTVLVWNGTVANLTLLALGSSAPEILLSAIEIVAKNFEAGALGPGTIVGSAAFNLFVIIAVCIVSIPSPEIRQIKETNVFMITAAFSLFAYAWLVLIVEGSWSPNRVDLWEALATLLLCPVLVGISYGADVGWLSGGSQPKMEQHWLAADYGDGSWHCPRGADLKELQVLDHQRQYGMPAQPPGGGFSGTGDGQSPSAGVLAFEIDAVEVMSSEAAQTYSVRVCRHGGTEGEVGCKYRMERLSAVPGYDFVAEEGTLRFDPGESEALVPVTILPKRLGDHKDTFQIILEDPEGGAIFNPGDDGGLDSGVLTVTILNHNESIMKGSCLMRFMSFIDRVVNLDEMRLGNATWWKELQDAAIKVSDDDEDDEEAGPPSASDYIMHIISAPWKVLITLIVPPPVYCGGWVCFVAALTAIGGLTLLVMDFANLFGCVVDIEDQITAITVVALGTSMPDLFASRTAAVQDKYADASIVNVTGSNSVNVFMGIGLPWTMAAIYHTAKGDYFKVDGGDLTFSVIAFTIAACMALALIRFRRAKFGGELGGPLGAKIFSGVFMVLLWIFYLAVSIWKTIIGKADLGEQMQILFQCIFVLENVLAVCALIVYCMTKDSPQGKPEYDLEDAVATDMQDDGAGPPTPNFPYSVPAKQEELDRYQAHQQRAQQPAPRLLKPVVDGAPVQQHGVLAPSLPQLPPPTWPRPDKMGMQPNVYGAPASASGLRRGADAQAAPHPTQFGRPARQMISFTSVAMASIALARMRRGQRRRERLQWLAWMRQQRQADRPHQPSSFSDVAVPVLAAVRLKRRALHTRLKRSKKNEDEEAFLSPQASFRSFGEDQPPTSSRGGGEAMSRVGNFIVNHAQDWAALGVAGYMATRMV